MKPFKPLALYDGAQVRTYMALEEGSSSPHIFQFARAAFSEMVLQTNARSGGPGGHPATGAERAEPPAWLEAEMMVMMMMMMMMMGRKREA